MTTPARPHSRARSARRPAADTGVRGRQHAREHRENSVAPAKIAEHLGRMWRGVIEATAMRLPGSRIVGGGRRPANASAITGEREPLRAARQRRRLASSAPTPEALPGRVHTGCARAGQRGRRRRSGFRRERWRGASRKVSFVVQRTRTAGGVCAFSALRKHDAMTCSSPAYHFVAQRAKRVWETRNMRSTPL